MLAIVGLGNPGADYSVTRHNAGFILADALADSWDLELRLMGLRAQAAKGTVHGRELILVKPLTFMNRSGEVVREIAVLDDFDLGSDLLIVVDDAALPTGMFRMRARGSAGGHNGLDSIDRALGTSDYARLRIGVGPVPEDVDDIADWVLGRFTEKEIEVLGEVIPTMVEAVSCWITDGIETTMNRYNRRVMESE